MYTKIFTKTDKILEEELLSLKYTSYFQSKNWADFQSEYFNRKFWFINFYENSKIISSCLVLKIKLPFNKNYLYIPAGPDLYDYTSDIYKNLISEIYNIAKKERSIFLKMESTFSDKDMFDGSISSNLMTFYNNAYNFFVKTLGFSKSYENKIPNNTLFIDLSKDENQILKEMKQKGRYNIKKAEEYGIKIEKTKNPNSKEFNEFWKLTKETTKRDKFSSNPKEYYFNLLKFLNSKNIETYLYSAYFENKIIASAISVFYKNKATYYYGASSNKYRNLMAPYLLQWQMIKDAKYSNMKVYDFLGIYPSYYEENGNYIVNDSFNRIKFKKKETVENFLNKHNFSGITEFKTKFGGEVINYMGSCDLIYNKFWYFIIKISKKIRKLKRKII